MRFTTTIISLLLVMNSVCYSQYSNAEISMGFKNHDFRNSPLRDVKVDKNGSIKYKLTINGNGKLVEIGLIKSDFDLRVDSVCRKEIESFVFIPPAFVDRNENYEVLFKFKFSRIEFKALSVSRARVVR